MEVKDKKIYDYIDDNKLEMEKLMKDYTNYIYTIIKNYNTKLSNEDTEEIILDVFLTLWRNESKLDINKKLSSYIAGITKNLIKYKTRQAKNELNIDDYDGEILNLTNIELFLIQDEERNIIAKQLDKVKQEEKEIFILYYYNDMSVKEIAKQLNISSSNVKIILFRVRKKIKKALKDRGYTSNEK